MTASRDERLARVALAACREPGDAWLTRSVHEIGGLDLYEHLTSGRTHRGIAGEVSRRLATVDPERELARGERVGLRYVVRGDDEWPTRLDDLASAEAVERTGGTPVGVWVRGPRRLDQLGRSVAVVGSRSSTTYGEHVAAEIAAGAAYAGWTVISGGAFGIDLAAHRGALAAGGRTVAVLACGADRVYPQAHEQLFDHLAAQEAVVSETVPGGAPQRQRFLTRNRIIAALARGTVVVEAATRSGALSTATWAVRIHRPLMGVPGPVTSATSQGVHDLVRTGRATLVTCTDDVLEVVADLGEHLPEPVRGPVRPRDLLSDRQRQVLEAVPAVRPAPADSIARVAGLEQVHVTTALDELSASGLVEVAGTGWRLARQTQEAPAPT